MTERWRRRLEIGQAMAELCRARVLIALVSFRIWRDGVGSPSLAALPVRTFSKPLAEAQRIACQIERAAERLPFEMKCLPRAIALSRLLRRRGLPHVLVFAVRPLEVGYFADTLHAWVETDGIKIIGEVPGPWIETLRLGNG